MAQTFEARLASPANINRVHAAKQAIEQARGSVQIIATKTPGVVIVLLTLPDNYRPEMFLPGIPFFLA